ncbi:MAG: cupin domain-containing protein [Verrucomicrobiota bacterium]
MLTAEAIIEHYGLEPLDQEGGYFRQVWRSGLRVRNSELCSRYPEKGDHPMGTLIYFLLTADSFSAMHRLPTAEHWFHHLGDSAEMLLLHENGRGELLRIGSNLEAGEKLQLTTPMGSWQGTKLVAGEAGFFFGSCMMVPGFEWSDFELGERETLCSDYPEFKDAVICRTREVPVEGKL